MVLIPATDRMFVCSVFGNGIGVSRNKQQRLMFKTLFSGELPEEKLDEPSADDQGNKKTFLAPNPPSGGFSAPLTPVLHRHAETRLWPREAVHGTDTTNAKIGTAETGGEKNKPQATAQPGTSQTRCGLGEGRWRTGPDQLTCCQLPATQRSPAPRELSCCPWILKCSS